METQLATKLLEHLQEPIVILAIGIIVLAGWIVKSSRSQERERHNAAIERQKMQAESEKQFALLTHVCNDSQEMLDKAFTTLSLLIERGRGHGND